MRDKFLIIFLLLTLACDQSSQTPFSSSFIGSQFPLVAIKPVEDQAKSRDSSKSASILTGAIRSRLQQKKSLFLTQKNEQFVVNMKLVQHEELPQTPPELSMSIHLEILDLRTSSPQVILQEVISYQTLLERPLLEVRTISWEDDSFRTCPLGLAHAKLSREIAARIEDYILLARKG